MRELIIKKISDWRINKPEISEHLCDRNLSMSQVVKLSDEELLKLFVECVTELVR